MMSFQKSSYTISVCLFFALSISVVVYFTLGESDPITSPTLWWLSGYSTTSNTSNNPSTTRANNCSRRSQANKGKNPAGPTILSHIVFSLAGSASTWERRSHYSDLWWAPNSTRGFVWLDQPPDLKNYSWLGTYPPYRVIKYDTTLDHSGSDRIARIVKAAFDELIISRGDDDEEVRWFVMGDDDTVFFKENLVTVLSRYDHTRMWYIGGISESVEQNEVHSYRTAFGGGGFALSYPLACQLASLMDGCVGRYTNFYGSDEKISACVGELGVTLTRESGFHQLDIRGDPYGLLAAHPVAPLVSLHHLEAVDPLFPYQTQLVSLATFNRAYRLDPPRTLQQSICYSQALNWSISVSWGYTVQLYPSLLAARELELPLRTFKTWNSQKEGPFEFNTRPFEDDPCDPRRPIVFFLGKVAEINGGNKTLATYKRVRNGKRSSCTQSSYKDAAWVNEIIVVASKMDPAEWLTAPQRHCCEVSVNNGWGWKTNVKVVVRSCNFGETIGAQG